MGYSRMKRRGRVRASYIAVSLFAVVAFAVAGFALTMKSEPPPASEKVANYTPPVHTPAPVHKVVVIGDSYAAGAGSTGHMGWAERMARNQVWDLTNLARGGTGYISYVKDPEKAKTACALDACPNFQSMIGDAAALSPDIVIVAGGRNDAPVNAAAKSAAILKFYQDLRAALPKVTIVAIGAFWDSTPAPDTLAEVTNDVKASAESVGGTFVDVGYTLAGHPENVAKDGVHPTDQGHLAIFEAAVARLQAAGIAV